MALLYVYSLNNIKKGSFFRFDSDLSPRSPRYSRGELPDVAVDEKRLDKRPVTHRLPTAQEIKWLTVLLQSGIPR